MNKERQWHRPAPQATRPGAQIAAFREWEKFEGERFAELRAIQHPTLVVNGVFDEMIPVSNSYRLSENLPNAVLITYPDAGHGSLSSIRSRSRDTRAPSCPPTRSRLPSEPSQGPQDDDSLVIESSAVAAKRRERLRECCSEGRGRLNDGPLGERHETITSQFGPGVVHGFRYAI